MSNDVKIETVEVPVTENPSATLKFEDKDFEASVRIDLTFDGDWTTMLKIREDEPVSEDEVRHAFAAELFAAITRLFG